MKHTVLATILMLIVAANVRAGDASQSRDENWPQWRGPLATGVAPHGNPPVEWSETKNVRWKIEIPGRGLSTPIVWGDLVFVQTAISTNPEADIPKTGDAETRTRPGRRRRPPGEDGAERRERRRERGADGPRGRRGPGRFRMRGSKPTAVHKFVVLAFDRKSGKRVWEHVVREEVPHEGAHRDGSLAACSPVTDGEYLISYFGSRGLYAFDLQGKLLWETDFGDMRTRNGFGEGGAPALYGNTVVVTWDHEDESFIVAVDKRTGKLKWKVDRDEPTSWATPLVLEVSGKPQVVASGTNRIRSYDLATGDLRWECGGMTRNVIPSPVTDRDLLYVTSGFRGSALLAVRYAVASGDITGSKALAWTYEGKGTPYVPSPLLYDDALYFLDSNKAMVSCVDAKTGKPHYAKQRLEGIGGVYASPVAAHGRVYIAGRGGKTAVFRSGTVFAPLAINTLDDSFSASPAIVGGELFLRGEKHLYCIANDR